ncbi:MAG: amidase [Gemmatimonadetes bacterium]|nr:amidase [Gemmatimonadota bacterium]
MDRRDFLTASAATLALGTRGIRELAAQPRAFSPVELSAVTLADQLRARTITSRQLTQAYLTRIAQIDAAGPTLRSVIEVNPDALAIAAERDAERARGIVRGPLHGLPVLVKDNLDTADRMQTTAGSLALVGMPAPRDAFVVQKLREAGAVLLGKTNLSEWANFRSTRSTSGWSARGGQTRNPYVLDRDPCGSSSGTGAAIAASLAAVGIGTETDGSIICPSGICGLVGLKPTVGLVSRSGIIPISASQDTAGPMTRTVADAALLLQAIAGRDANDAATASAPATVPDYVAALRSATLEGARIGVGRTQAGFDPRVDALFDRALDVLRAAGATVIDPCNVPTVGRTDEAELTVLLYEFKDGIEKYLASRGRTAKFRTLRELIAFNAQNAAREMPFFAQELFEQAEAKGPLTDAAYRDALAACRRFAREQGLDALFAQHRLDALVAPSNGPAWPIDHVHGDRYTGGNSAVAAVAGYPNLTVPMGQVQGLPVGLSFIGTAYTEARLLALGHAFEQRAKARVAPRYLRTLEGP